MGLLSYKRNLEKNTELIVKQNYEIIWAQTWKDTIRDIEWASHLPSLSPGRWAVGYNYLYVMTRILNELKPHTVLDIGLGISGTLITTYFDSQKFPDGEHIIIEQDPDWIKFYTNTHNISEVSKICFEKVVKKTFNGIEYNAYDNIGRHIKNKKFDIISVDGPKGSLLVSRRDIVEFIPQILKNDFVLLFDDAQRTGERATINEIRKKLSKSGIQYAEGYYPGMTDVWLISSLSRSFVCSM